MLIGLCLGVSDADALAGADTDLLSDLAARLSVESYVLNVLGPRQQRLGPREAAWLAGLRQQVSSSAIQNLLRDEELSQALARLAGEEIDLVLLKGAALRVERQDMAGRYQCDVDVLVRRPDLERAEALLCGMGFRLDDSFKDREALLNEHFHFGFERRGAVVEVHWDLDAHSPPGFLDRFWTGSRPVEWEGRGFRVPSPEHQLLFGCLHLSRHKFFAGLRWLADLALHLPLSPEVRGRFEKEAAAWPQRAVYCPLWVLSCFGVPGAEELGAGFEVELVERTVLRRLLPALLVAEPWLGLPGWRAGNALHEWLFSEQPLLPLLAEVSREGISRKLQAWG
ncbi:MAG TPA: nucleotidyltransferase family protein [Thermoanaerobaculia bacterium]|nr:nucleotidyltransferase family protein [Thermoanaerobaculia bacterium]